MRFILLLLTYNHFLPIYGMHAHHARMSETVHPPAEASNPPLWIGYQPPHLHDMVKHSSPRLGRTWRHDLTLRDLDTIMRLSESPQVLS